MKQLLGIILVITGVLNIIWGNNDWKNQQTNTGFIVGMIGFTLLV